MKPRRPILTTTAILSLFLGVAIALLWPRTGHTTDSLAYVTTSGNCYEISTVPHGISFHRGTKALDTTMSDPDELQLKLGWSFRTRQWKTSFYLKDLPLPQIPPPTTSKGVRASETTVKAYVVFIVSPPAHSASGFSWQNQTVKWDEPFTLKPVQSHETTLTIPIWSILVLLAISPLLLLRRVYSQRKLARLGLCPSCGYDLRATSNRCPECGRSTTS